MVFEAAQRMSKGWWLLLIVPSSIIVIYLIGFWILRRQGYAYRGVPAVYDGKEPYAEWARKMEQARQIQAWEEKE